MAGGATPSSSALSPIPRIETPSYWFCREIFPLVLAEEPELRLSVIGADPPSEVVALASANVRIPGHIPDVASFFDGCRLSVAHLRYGAVVKGKINQSLAFSLPVVATPQAVEGMFLVDGESALELYLM